MGWKLEVGAQLSTEMWLHNLRCYYHCCKRLKSRLRTPWCRRGWLEPPLFSCLLKESVRLRPLAETHSPLEKQPGLDFMLPEAELA